MAKVKLTKEEKRARSIRRRSSSIEQREDNKKRLADWYESNGGAPRAKPSSHKTRPSAAVAKIKAYHATKDMVNKMNAHRNNTRRVNSFSYMPLPAKFGGA
jgi:hypothetical protein